MNARPLVALALVLALASCTSPYPVESDECRIARMDAIAAEKCLADPACSAKWDSDLFRLQLEEHRAYLHANCAVRR